VAGADVRVGAVDIGTNTVRLLIAELDDGRLLDLERHTEIVGLGRGVDATGRFDPERIDHALAVLATYAERLRVHGVSRARAVATSATRDAGDGPEFLDRAASVLGLRPELIDGIEEAALSFRGATAALPGERPTLVIDPGGGSTEFVLGTSLPDYSVSLDIGSVRLTERLLPERPATADRVAAAAEEVAEIFAIVRLPTAPARVIGVAGTFTSLAAISLDLDAYDRNAVHGSTLTIEDLERLVDRLAQLTVEETAAIPSLEPKRAPVLLGGAIVAREAVRVSGLDSVTVSEADLLDGIVLALAEPG
jgi:exopolyphosphatase/guanosine-5'-triphosphate,3'-diphosphate pyrophosphatase